jgi:hypothetical protein
LIIRLLVTIISTKVICVNLIKLIHLTITNLPIAYNLYYLLNITHWHVIAIKILVNISLISAEIRLIWKGSIDIFEF